MRRRRRRIGINDILILVMMKIMVLQCPQLLGRCCLLLMLLLLLWMGRCTRRAIIIVDDAVGFVELLLRLGRSGDDIVGRRSRSVLRLFSFFLFVLFFFFFGKDGAEAFALLIFLILSPWTLFATSFSTTSLAFSSSNLSLEREAGCCRSIFCNEDKDDDDDDGGGGAPLKGGMGATMYLDANNGAWRCS